MDVDSWGRYGAFVIPVLLAVGVIAGLFGRRGLRFVVGAALVWPVALVATGVGLDVGLLAGGAALAAVNAAVGVVISQALGWVLSSVRAHA